MPMELLGQGLHGTIVTWKPDRSSQCSGIDLGQQGSRWLPLCKQDMSSSLKLPWRHRQYVMPGSHLCAKTLYRDPNIGYTNVEIPHANPRCRELQQAIQTQQAEDAKEESPTTTAKELAQFETHIVGSHLRTRRKENPKNCKETQFCAAKKVPNVTKFSSAFVDPRKDTWEISHQMPKFPELGGSNVPLSETMAKRYCCARQCGRTTKEDGRPLTPPLGRSAQLADYIEKRVVKSDVRRFLKPNVEFPAYNLRCLDDKRTRDQKLAMPNVDPRCLDLRPTIPSRVEGSPMLATKDEAWDLNQVIYALSCRKDALLQELSGLARERCKAKYDFNSLSRVERNTPHGSQLAKKMRYLEQQHRQKVEEIQHIGNDIKDLMIQGRQLERKFICMTVDKGQCKGVFTDSAQAPVDYTDCKEGCKGTLFKSTVLPESSSVDPEPIY